MNTILGGYNDDGVKLILQQLYWVIFVGVYSAYRLRVRLFLTRLRSAREQLC